MARPKPASSLGSHERSGPTSCSRRFSAQCGPARCWPTSCPSPRRGTRRSSCTMPPSSPGPSPQPSSVSPASPTPSARCSLGTGGRHRCGRRTAVDRARAGAQALRRVLRPPVPRHLSADPPERKSRLRPRGPIAPPGSVRLRRRRNPARLGHRAVDDTPRLCHLRHRVRQPPRSFRRSSRPCVGCRST